VISAGGHCPGVTATPCNGSRNLLLYPPPVTCCFTLLPRLALLISPFTATHSSAIYSNPFVRFMSRDSVPFLTSTLTAPFLSRRYPAARQHRADTLHPHTHPRSSNPLPGRAAGDPLSLSSYHPTPPPPARRTTSSASSPTATRTPPASPSPPRRGPQPRPAPFRREPPARRPRAVHSSAVR
jgi:hypothetical protein